MEDKLVTLAIRTYQRAQMIKTVLEKEGIETVIHNLNLEHPEMAVGVRVRIRESDLPRALTIVEQMERAWEDEQEKEIARQVLIPLDFADYNPKTIDIGFQMAGNMGAEVVLMYVYFSPAFTISMNNDVSAYTISDGELLRRIITSANADVDNMGNLIRRRIAAGELPEVSFRFEVKEGVPEDQILDYCKRYTPDLVVMGTRGKKISNELIGSVTAEVIESCGMTVFAIPEMMKLNDLLMMKRVAFITNFDQKDLIAIDKVIATFGVDNLEITFIHGSNKKQVWDEIMLTGIKTYFSNHYPQLRTNYDLVESTESPEKINEFIENMKVDVLAFNSRRKNIFTRIFNPGLAYKMIYHSNVPLFVTHI
ncbi:MAG: universal stress protein [Paludibacter sp.]|jgi:nucleotide-binding universal stress UspA family protein|nr:universal stress protein [Paludibacter sp.]